MPFHASLPVPAPPGQPGRGCQTGGGGGGTSCAHGNSSDLVIMLLVEPKGVIPYDQSEEPLSMFLKLFCCVVGG